MNRELKAKLSLQITSCLPKQPVSTRVTIDSGAYAPFKKFQFWTRRTEKRLDKA